MGYDCKHSLLEIPGITWSWVQDRRYQYGIPNLEALMALPAVDSIGNKSASNPKLICYAWFTLFSPLPYDTIIVQKDVQPFAVKDQDCQILWKMELHRPAPDPTKSVHMTPRAVLRSTEFRSTMNHFWIPNHGVEFFDLFVHDMQKKWEELFENARVHLVQSVGFSSHPSLSCIPQLTDRIAAQRTFAQ